jgi:hypothetical protein
MNSSKVGFINSIGVYSADLFRDQILTISYLLNHLERHLRDMFRSLLRRLSDSYFKILSLKKFFSKNSNPTRLQKLS